MAIHLEASDLGDLFAEAARALAEVIAGGDLARAEGDYLTVELEAPDRDALLLDWLNELVYLSDREGRVFVELELDEVDDRRLRARVRGAALPVERNPVKAATFHGLRIREDEGGLSAQVLLDV